MSNATQQLKAQQRRQKFADLLREMFQLNQPELDFGLYRIMHARKDDINRFIEQDLPRITQEAFSQYASQDQAQMEAELEEHIKSAKGLGMDPDAIPKVQELRQKLQGGFDLAREEGEVYDALVTFFNRYYNEGDFLSRRVYKDGTYAIPYQGEEVVLHWANKDQYYIKSSETLRDYSFRLNPDAGPGEDPMRVHFKLVDAEAGAKDNNKESGDGRRVFVLDVENPFELIEGEATEYGDQHTELQCRFVFRPATQSDWTEAEKKKATAAAQKKPPTQDALRAIAEERLLGAASDLPDAWKRALTKPYGKADGSRADYSMLAGQLNNYTKKNTFDYFIHKDLGGFLTRELDFYIKNELLDWNDIASLKNDTARLAPLLSKIEVIQSLGSRIIAFLAQLENFQKKLWLKKKFVTETNYCITLDKLSEYESLLSEVFNNKSQLEAWKENYQIDLEKLSENHKSLSWKALLANPDYRYMMVDTGYFDEAFKSNLISSIESLDSMLGGVLVHSENFQALNLLRERYKERIKVIYIDPPYNTGDDGFPYKDGYQSSTWMTMIRDRAEVAKEYLAKDGLFFCQIGDEESNNLEMTLNEVFSEKKNTAIARRGIKNVQSQFEDISRLNQGYDSIHIYSKNVGQRLPHLTHNLDVQQVGKWDTFWRGTDRPTMRYKLLGVSIDNGQWRWESGRAERAVENYQEYLNKHAATKSLDDWYVENMQSGKKLDFVRLNDQGVVQYYVGPQTYRLVSDNWLDIPSSGNFTDFAHEKSFPLMNRVISWNSSDGDIVLDYFAGSGSTAEAAIKGVAKCRYILVEMGDYFDSTLRPRIARSVYAGSDLNDSGTSSGISHAFKYLRLESYEDALGNLALKRSDSQRKLLEEDGTDEQAEARESYIVNYMLEIETRDSQSLLSANQFVDPTLYTLNVRSAAGDETKSVNVDLLETFNYLLGLEVEHIAAPIYFQAELNKGEYGRWQAKVKRSDTGKWWFRTVYGTNRAGQQVLVVWRNLPSVIDGEADGIQKDNAVLDAVLIEKLSIRLTESQDDEIDVLYVNGDHNISIPRSRKGEPMEQARIQLIEEAFHRLMFADTEAVH